MHPITLHSLPRYPLLVGPPLKKSLVCVAHILNLVKLTVASPLKQTEDFPTHTLSETINVSRLLPALLRMFLGELLGHIVYLPSGGTARLFSTVASLFYKFL